MSLTNFWPKKKKEKNMFGLKIIFFSSKIILGGLNKWKRWTRTIGTPGALEKWISKFQSDYVSFVMSCIKIWSILNDQVGNLDHKSTNFGSFKNFSMSIYTSRTFFHLEELFRPTRFVSSRHAVLILAFVVYTVWGIENKTFDNKFHVTTKIYAEWRRQ